MGSKLQRQAAVLGLTKLRLTTLYAQPMSFRMTMAKYVPDIADIIRDYINFQDPSFIQDRSGGGLNNSYYYLSQKAEIYVEILDKNIVSFGRGYQYRNWDQYWIRRHSNQYLPRAIQISIYCDDDNRIREIAQAIAHGEDRIRFLARIDWKKIEQKFKVRADDCIAEWKKWLPPSSEAALSSLSAARPPPIKEQTAFVLQTIFIAAMGLFLVSSCFTFIWAVGYSGRVWYQFFTLSLVLISLGIGCAVAGGIFNSLKRRAEQYLREQRLLSEEKQQQLEIPVKVPSPSQSSTAFSTSVHSPALSLDDTIVCNQCGSRNPKGAHFCKNCGSAL